jgi:hypothetical protein
MEIKRIGKDWLTMTVEDDGHVIDLDIEVAIGGLVIRAACRDCDSRASYYGRKWVKGRGHVVRAFHLPNLEEAEEVEDETN